MSLRTDLGSLDDLPGVNLTPMIDIVFQLGDPTIVAPRVTFAVDHPLGADGASPNAVPPGNAIPALDSATPRR